MDARSALISQVLEAIKRGDKRPETMALGYRIMEAQERHVSLYKERVEALLNINQGTVLEQWGREVRGRIAC